MIRLKVEKSDYFFVCYDTIDRRQIKKEKIAPNMI